MFIRSLTITAMLAISAASLLSAEKPAATSPIKRSGPMAGLPSAPGPTIAKIQALGDNQWLDLGSPAPDPKWGKGRGRSWGAKMVYAPDIGGAFLSGQGEHGYIKPDGHYDDLFLYDVYAHRWICLDPGFNTTTLAEDIKSGKLRLNDDCQMVYADGSAVYHYGGHIYQTHTYDTDAHRYVCCWNYTGFLDDQNIREEPWYLAASPLMQAQAKGKPDRVIGMPYLYDTVTGRLERPGTKGDRPRGGESVVYYLPSSKLVFMYNQDDKLRFYDLDAQKVTESGSKGPTPLGIDYGACWDSKRDRVLVGGGNYRPEPRPDEGRFYIYDVKTNTWTNPPNKGKVPLTMAHFNANVMCVHYDSVGDKVLCFQNRGGAAVGGLYIFDPETSTWSETVTPFATGVPIDGGCWSGFYSPELNAHFFAIAGDSDDNGTVWVYRYKKASKSGK